ncbi:MAG TPA: C1 family peptidase [Leadbetterella sp.]|nr:C1 family peptidase [Leadbetterella sp.]
MKKTKYYVPVLLMHLLFMSSCKIVESISPTNQPDDDKPAFGFGWLGNEDLGTVPNNVKFGFAGNANLPTSFDLSELLPPVASQGSYATCVSWATGYYGKTATEALTFGYKPADLAKTNYQISAKDLYTSLPEGNSKGADCNGSSYLINMEMLQYRGAATVATVPYTNLGSCLSSSIQPSWTTEAAKHKIKNYRIIDDDVFSIKQQIANRIPVIAGFKLADNFMTWNSANVYSSHTTFNSVGQHAYHGMAIVGYDDKKGPNGAFKVVNSWGPNWGNNGFIWVDYNFFINTFLQRDANGNGVLLTMSDAAIKNTEVSNPPPVTSTQLSGVELSAWVEEDVSTFSTTKNPTSRKVLFNFYNSGTQTATTAKPWNSFYLYYNAYDADEYGIIFNYNFTNQNLAENKYLCGEKSCDFNLNIPPKNNFGFQFLSTNILQTDYTLPSNLNGYYYLVLIVDGSDVFKEYDEDDNFFYTTEDPILFKNGQGARLSGTGAEFSFHNDIPFNSPIDRKIRFQSAVNKSNPNAYSKDEIMEMIKNHKKSGDFQKKVEAYHKSKSDANNSAEPQKQ